MKTPIIFGMCAISAVAGANLIQDGSFENYNPNNAFYVNPGAVYAYNTGASIDGFWTVESTQYDTDILTNNVPAVLGSQWPATPYGNVYAYLGDSSSAGTIGQLVSLNPGTYTLSFAQGSFQFAGFTNTVEANIVDESTALSITGPVDYSVPDFIGWTNQSLSFAVAQAGVYDVQLSSLNGTIGLVDNVQLTPEPAPFAALGLGALGLLLRRRKR